MNHKKIVTMITVLTTDAVIAADVLKVMIKKIGNISINMVVGDGDTSTNDTMIILANGLAEN